MLKERYENEELRKKVREHIMCEHLSRALEEEQQGAVE